MSHEQNMHHHLIYLANTQLITIKHSVWHSMLMNMHRCYTFRFEANSRQASFNSVANVVSTYNSWIDSIPWIHH
jgi:ureidoglycolate hydrolase